MVLRRSNHYTRTRGRATLRARAWSLLLIFLGCVITVGILASTRNRARTIPTLSYWYWYRPFEVSARQDADARAAGISRLLVFAGDLSYDGKGISVDNTLTWKDRTGLPVVLVFRGTEGCYAGPRADLVAPRKGMSRDALAQALASRILPQVENARRRGITVTGVQLDFDCPTRLLEEFAATLAALRPRLHGLQLSTTALATWLSSPDFAAVAKSVDWYSLMVYGLKSPVPLQNEYANEVNSSVHVNRPWSRPESLEELSAPPCSCII